MNDAGAVDDVETVDELCQTGAERAVVRSDEGHQRRAAHQLHREEPVPAVGEQFVEGDEIRVGDVRERPEFPLKTIKRGAFGVAEDLQRDAGAARTIDGFINNPEASFAQSPDQREPFRSSKRTCHTGPFSGQKYR